MVSLLWLSRVSHALRANNTACHFVSFVFLLTDFFLFVYFSNFIGLI